MLAHFRRAVDEGATVVTGGSVPAMPPHSRMAHGCNPTIWTGLDDTASVMREEIFGPAATLHRSMARTR